MEATHTLKESQRALQEMYGTLNNLHQITSSKAIKILPEDIRKTL